LIGEFGLGHDVAEHFGVVERFSGGINGDITEGVEAEFECCRHGRKAIARCRCGSLNTVAEPQVVILRTNDSIPTTMAQRSAFHDDRLFLPSLQAPEMESTSARQRLAELERLFSAAQEEIALLTGERDELVAAIKRWAKADRTERQELLLEATTLELRTEVKQLRAETKRLKRENTALHMRLNGDQPLRRLRA